MEERRNEIHRRVQRKIAGNILENIDPSGELVGEFFPDRVTQFKQLDTDTKKQFEDKYGKYKKSESPYSIQNICWLIGAFAVFYYTDFYRAVLYDRRIMRLWLNIGVIMISVNISIGAFLIVYLSFIKKVRSYEWEKQYPALIPVATAAFVIGGICMTVGLWPVWGPFTPVILFILFMGFVVTIAMLPNF